MINEKFLTRKELASILGVTVRTIDTYVAKGLLPYFRIGGAIRFPKRILDTSFTRENGIEKPVNQRQYEPV